jgi:glycosyltransferase involved in cell wall biosynthesis
MTMGDPLISVVVPCFNGAAWVSHAVESVLNQDERDFELILADDASTDASVDIVRRAAKADSRVRVLLSERNRGMTANWNTGLATARGRFICKLDCDDAWRPGTLHSLLGAFVKFPELTAAFCRTVQCDAQLEPTDAYLGDQAFLRRGFDPSLDCVRPAEDWYEWCFDDIQIWHSNAFMIRRSTMVDHLGGWDQRFGCASDTDLILRVLELGGEVAHLGHVGVRYRATPGSVSSNGRRQGWVSVEGQLACALSLQRTSDRKPLSRHLALQRRRYRAALHKFRDREDYHPPHRVAKGHVELMEELRRMPASSRMAWRARCWLSELLRGGHTNATG